MARPVKSQLSNEMGVLELQFPLSYVSHFLQRYSQYKLDHSC
jgi:hypothetical protein